jgi:Uma2 family endonuclease
VHVFTPSPTYGHQYLLGRLHAALAQALEGWKDLVVLASPADIVLGPYALVQPDLFVLRIDPGAPPKGWSEVGVPMIAIEVLSPSTAPCDRGAKRRIYQRAGVAEYWLVDPDARLVERWTPTDTRPEVVDERLEWRVGGTVLFSASTDQLFGDRPAQG